ncbi:MAG TPA: hypothetical protein VFG61_04725 [Gaiellaceae bacterium]|nr:hypothetical protein [Gaiellaceae bacterium]
MRSWRTASVLAFGILIGVVLLAPPAGAHFQASISHIWSHIKPKADARYLPGGKIPAGRTIRGTYSIDGTAAAVSDDDSTDISFGWTLADAPIAHFIAEGATPPASCPGNAANPRAAKGHLCVYEADQTNADGGTRAVYDPVTYVAGIANTHGFGVYMYGAAATGFYTSHGSWAVTTPSPPASPRVLPKRHAPAPGGGPGF